MINKSENTASNVVASTSASLSTQVQNVMGNLLGVSNTLDASISTLPLEMVYHIGSFLRLKDKVSFHQALIDAGIISLDEREVLQEFRDEFLTEKINIVLDGKEEDYDFSKFYTSDAPTEETSNLYAFLFNEMCKDFQKRAALSEEIVELIKSTEAVVFIVDDYNTEVINSEVIDGEKIQAYVDRADPDAPKNATELVEHLFPNLTNSDIRKELEERVQEFDSKKGLMARQFSYSPITLTKRLLAFLKMDEKYRGIPIKLAARTQKLASSHLRPIILKANKKMQTMPVEVLRAWLIMTIDEEQTESFCEKIIEIGAKNNPFYTKGSPYYHLLKHDLLYRMNLFSVRNSLRGGCKKGNEAYMHCLCYCADDDDIRHFINSLMTKISQIQIKNGEDPVNENQPKDFSALCSEYFREVRVFNDLMEDLYGIFESLRKAYSSRISLAKRLTPDPDALEGGSPEYMLSSFVRSKFTFSALMRLLRAKPHYINAQDVNGDTLLHLSIKTDADIVTTLADLNADLNIKNAQGLTPLMLTVQLESMYLLGDLLKLQTLDVNKCDDFGNTALHHAILAGKKMAMHRLLTHEATDKTIANVDGKTPRELARLVGLLPLYDHLNQAT